MSSVGTIASYAQPIGAKEGYFIIAKQSAKIQPVVSYKNKIESYLANVSTVKPIQKKKIEALINGNFRIAICPRNVEYCQSIAQSLNLDEDIEEALIGEMEDYFEDAPEEDAFNYEKFANEMGDSKIVAWFKQAFIQFDQSHEGTLLEIINYLSKVPVRGVGEEIKRVKVLYELYGDDAFPWKLPTMAALSDRYLLHSEIEEQDDENYYEEDSPCRHNNCGSKRSKIQLFEHARTDNGKVVVKRCVKCNSIRN